MIIFTCAPGHEQIALNEIHAIDKDSSDFTHIARGIGLVKTSFGFDDFFNRYEQAMPIFIRHIFPVQQEGMVSEISDVWARNIQIPPDKRFSVQTRVFDSEVKPYEINNLLAQELKSNVLDIKNPEIIISVVILKDCFYSGISTPKQNLSKWAGGEPEYPREPDSVSRAERKLIEAIEVFDIKLPSSGRVLDLGAAPGGWSRILANKGMEVTAVDPALLSPALSPELSPELRIRHEKKTAQDFFSEIKNNGNPYDIIVNDMKMDYKESIDIMIMARQFLSPGGICVLTLKLPEKGQQKNAQKAVSILRKYFSFVEARQLFHNRSEVTVVLGKGLF